MAKKISTKVVLALHMGVPIAIGRGVKSRIVLVPLRRDWGVNIGGIELLYH
jgi:hypothetical protein